MFVNSMSDLFHDDVPDRFVDEVLSVMALVRPPRPERATTPTVGAFVRPPPPRALRRHRPQLNPTRRSTAPGHSDTESQSRRRGATLGNCLHGRLVFGDPPRRLDLAIGTENGAMAFRQPKAVRRANVRVKLRGQGWV